MINSQECLYSAKVGFCFCQLECLRKRLQREWSNCMPTLKVKCLQELRQRITLVMYHDLWEIMHKEKDKLFELNFVEIDWRVDAIESPNVLYDISDYD